MPMRDNTEKLRDALGSIASNVILREDADFGIEVFNEVVTAARVVCDETGTPYEAPELPEIRVIVATGLPGYGPEASDGNYAICTSWANVADAVSEELRISADSLCDQAESEAELGDYAAAWAILKKIEEIELLCAKLDNKRQSAPLYAGKPELWAETIQRTIGENFAFDISDSCRLYVWESVTFAADEDEDA